MRLTNVGAGGAGGLLGFFAGRRVGRWGEVFDLVLSNATSSSIRTPQHALAVFPDTALAWRFTGVPVTISAGDQRDDTAADRGRGNNNITSTKAKIDKKKQGDLQVTSRFALAAMQTGSRDALDHVGPSLGLRGFFHGSSLGGP